MSGFHEDEEHRTCRGWCNLIWFRLFTNLVVQCEQLGIPVLTGMPTSEEVTEGFDVAVDAIFEFSTKVLRVVAPLVPAVKINIAFFEKYLR